MNNNIQMPTLCEKYLRSLLEIEMGFRKLPSAIKSYLKSTQYDSPQTYISAFFKFCILLLLPIVAPAQVEDHIRTGNNLYEDGEFVKAEVEYSKALKADAKSYEGAFNLGDSYFRQEKYEEAAIQFESIAEESKNATTKSWAYHNQGNSLLKNEQLDESIDAYKNALRSNPSNEAARYNLAYAQKMKQQKQEQEDEGEDKDEDKKDKEDKEKKDKKDDEGDKDDEKKNEKGDENNKEEPKPQPNKLSKEDAKRLLDAQKNQEQKTQEKLREFKAKKGTKVKIEKDW
ncbi:MAG: tetratricopeptide repeat protein [Flavobacteriales bacterium]|nr:tetratricopeptide repeat protein [Flavobacteriales bacterium]